jgi:hypothetical protein
MPHVKVSKKQEIAESKIDNPKEKRRLFAWVPENLHKKAKGHAGFLGINIQNFVEFSVQHMIGEIESGKFKMPDNIKDLFKD